MANMRKTLQDAILKVITDTVGPTSSATYKIVTTDKKLLDRPLEDLPHIVVFCRQKNMEGKELGTLNELWAWEAHIYYFDIVEDYDTGEIKRDYISEAIEVALSDKFRLENAMTQVTTDRFERVYDSDVTSVLFDSSGQEQYYSFVTEIYLTVRTQRN